MAVHEKAFHFLVSFGSFNCKPFGKVTIQISFHIVTFTIVSVQIESNLICWELVIVRDCVFCSDV